MTAAMALGVLCTVMVGVPAARWALTAAAREALAEHGLSPTVLAAASVFAGIGIFATTSAVMSVIRLVLS